MVSVKSFIKMDTSKNLEGDSANKRNLKSMEEIMAEIKERSEALKKLHEMLRKKAEDDLKK
jgi:hypothetical protein